MYLIWRRDATAKGAKKNTPSIVKRLKYSTVGRKIQANKFIRYTVYYSFLKYMYCTIVCRVCLNYKHVLYKSMLHLIGTYMCCTDVW